MEREKTDDALMRLLLSIETNPSLTPASLASTLDHAEPEAKAALLLAGYRAMRLQRGHDIRTALKALKLEPEEMAVAANPKRKPPKSRAKPQETTTHIEVRARRLTLMLSIMEEWKLSTGKSLGDATKADLLVEADASGKLADGHLRNVLFYTSIAKGMKAEDTVRTAIALDDLHRLKEECYASN